MSKRTSRRQRRNKQSQRDKPRVQSPALSRIRARDSLPNNFTYLTKDLKRIVYLGSFIVVGLIALSLYIN